MMRTSNYLSQNTLDLIESHTQDFKSTKSKSVYMSKIIDICDYCEKDFLELTKNDVLEFFDYVKRRSVNTRLLWLRIYRSIAQEADQVYGTRLIDSFILPEQLEQEVYIDPQKMPAISDIDKLLDYLKESGDDQTFLMIALMLSTGISIKELISLKAGNIVVDTEGAVFLMFEPKTKEGITRYIPLTKDIAELLQKFRARGAESIMQNDYIFLNKLDQPLSLRSAQLILQKACEAAGTDPIRLRDLKDIARAGMLKGGATFGALSYQTGLSQTWFFRLDHLVRGMNLAAANYNVLRVTNDKSFQEIKTEE